MWSKEDVKHVAKAMSGGHYPDVPAAMTATAELLAARGGTMTAEELDALARSWHGATVPEAFIIRKLLGHTSALGARVAVLEANNKDLVTQAVQTSAELNAALADNAAVVAAHQTIRDVWMSPFTGNADDRARSTVRIGESILKTTHPSAALLEELRALRAQVAALTKDTADLMGRKALVRARNEGRKQAEGLCEAMAKEADQDREDASGGAEESAADGAGAALWTARNRIRAMTEPEP